MDKKDILVKLHAYIASDGSIDTWKSKEIRGKNTRIRKRFRVRFYNEDKKLIKDFINSVKKIYSNEKYIRYSEKRFEVEVRGQIISKKILGLGSVISKNWEMPKNLTKNQKTSWIRTFADCDGTVGNYGYNRYVAIDSINLKGLKQIVKALAEIEISSRIQEVKYKNKTFYRLKVSGRDNLTKYDKIISFNHTQKQKKLKEAIDSYKDRSFKNPLYNLII